MSAANGTNAIASPAALLDAAPQSRPKDAEGAAKQFEALLIGQMLRSAREAAQDDDGDSPGQTMVDLADQQFSQLLANNGGMGLAHMITAGLKEGEPNAHQRSSGQR
jgi:Rod binding domain-containing protein